MAAKLSKRSASLRQKKSDSPIGLSQSEPASAAMLAHVKAIGDSLNREIAAQAAAKAAGKAVRT